MAKPTRIHLIGFQTVLAVAAGLVAACQAGTPTPQTNATVTAEGPFDLEIRPYNYTDHYIDSFYVDGNWGGNVFVSTPTSGGGGGACCVRWSPWMKVPKIYRVRWVADACIYQEEVGESREVFNSVRHLWKEQDVTLTTPPPAKPEAFEVHFYKDGRIEVAITDTYNPPRLKLPRTEDRQRPGVPDWPQCTPEQMRTYQE